MVKIKRLRVLVSIALSLVMVGALAGCGTQNQQGTKAGASSTPTTLTTYGLLANKPFTGQTIRILLPNANQYNAIQARTSEFTNLTGIKVDYIYVPYGNLLQKITTEGVANTGYYDVVNYQDSWGPSLKNYLQPLDSLVARDKVNLSKYPSAYRQGITIDGQTYGIPLRGHTQMLFYRKDIFQKLNLTPPTTWTELENDATTISQKTNTNGIAMYYGKGNDGQNLALWTDYLWSNGGNIFDSQWKPIFNNQQGVQATQRYVDLLLKDKAAAPGSVSFNEYDAFNSVAQGKSAMVMGWWWHYSDLTNPKATAPGVASNIGFVSIPQWQGQGTATYAIDLPLGIMKDSKHQAAAWEYRKWVSNPDLEKNIVMDSLTNTSPSDQHDIVIVQTPNLQDTELNKLSNGFYAIGAKSLASSRIMPQTPQWPQVSDVLSAAISSIASGAPVQATLDQAANSVQTIMQNAGYYK